MCNINCNLSKISRIFGRLALLVATVCLIQQAAAGPQVTDVRIGVYPGKTRWFWTCRRRWIFANFHPAQTVPCGCRYVGSDMVARMRNPPRGGLITGMRFGLFKPGLSRVVLDPAGPVKITKAFLVKPLVNPTEWC